MHKNVHELETIKNQIRPHLGEYLRQQGVDVVSGKNFRCFTGTHPDNDPSCGIFDGSKGMLFHCFSCSERGDIFKAAHYLEGLPAEGPGFVFDNVFKLAERFGIDVPKLDLTEEQLYEHQIYHAYSEASRIIVTSSSPKVAERLQTYYCWHKDTITQLGIGTVSSYEDYMTRMTKGAGFSRTFLRDVDLDNKKLFSPENLIYTVRDEFGRPVGFAARSLIHEEAIEKYEMACDLYGETSEQAKDLKGKIPTKYYNSMERERVPGSNETKIKNPIYQKGKRLFGFHVAKKSGSPLYVFEGYADCATAQNAGLKTACAIGSTSFTKDHLEMVLSHVKSIKHVVFVLDADKGGKDGTERFVALVDEVLGGHVGLQIEIVVMPEGSDDPDKMIREQGLLAFTSLPRMSIFAWRLAKLLEHGEDRVTIADRMARLIVNEPMPTLRYKLCQEVAEKLELPVDVLLDTVKVLTDEDRLAAEEQKNVIAKKVADQIRRDPSRLGAILERAATELEGLGAAMRGYNARSVMESIRHCRKQAKQAHAAHRLATGWPIFDEKFGGFPVKGAFIAVPGKPNQGKTSWMVNAFWRVIDNNPDAICVYHTMDDAMDIFLPRVLGSKYRVPSVMFKETADFHEQLKANNQLGIIEEADAWLDHVVSNQRLIAADTKMLPRDLGAFAMWLKDLRKQFPEKPILGFADNFHHYDIRSGAPSAGEEKVQYIARYAKDLCIQYDCTLVMTMELPKDSLKPGIRPRVGTLKGSSSMAYEASANIGVYNDMKDYGAKSLLVWEDKQDMESYEGPSGEKLTRAKRKPIIELVFDKSKIYKGFDGLIYYKLDPDTGHYEECPGYQQESYAAIAANPPQDDTADDDASSPNPKYGAGKSKFGGGNNNGGYKGPKKFPKPVTVTDDIHQQGATA